MSTKEPALKQELGPKRYKQKVEEANAFYDKNMAGKRNPKTGEYYHPINFNDPTKSKFGHSTTLAFVGCKNKHCDEYFSLNRRTRAIICSKCKTLNTFSKELIEELERD